MPVVSQRSETIESPLALDFRLSLRVAMIISLDCRGGMMEVGGKWPSERQNPTKFPTTCSGRGYELPAASTLPLIYHNSLTNFLDIPTATYSAITRPGSKARSISEAPANCLVLPKLSPPRCNRHAKPLLRPFLSNASGWKRTFKISRRGMGNIGEYLCEYAKILYLPAHQATRVGYFHRARYLLSTR